MKPLDRAIGPVTENSSI